MFVGAQHEQAVTDLVAAFDRVRASKQPELVSLESETGLGKTRILQEFYARLARDRQGLPAYWPDRLDSRATGDVLRDRKRITPAAPFTIPGGAPLHYLWWGIACEESETRVPAPRLLQSAGQFEVHARHLAESGPDHVDAALTLVRGVVEIVGLASPVQVATSSLDIVKHLSGWLQSWRRKEKATRALAADRQVDPAALTDDERCLRLAEAVRAAATASLTVVVVVDDGHHSDPSLVSFLRQLTQVEVGAVLVVVSAWPSLVRQRSEGDAGSLGALLDSTRALLGKRFVRIPVEKLGRPEITALLLEAAPRTRPPLVERFCDVIDGNPLLLRLYLDLDVIKRDIRDGALDTDPVVFGRLPADARGAWQALWRQLPASTKFALAVASVQGPEFFPAALERAAAALGDFEAGRSGLAGAHRTYGWVSPPAADQAAFTERLRYEVARENQVELLDPGQMTVVRKALVTHALETKASAGWSGLPLATRRAVLRTHVRVAQEEPEVTAPAEVADSAFQLSQLEEGCGDLGAALEAARDAVEFAQQAGTAAALLVYQARLGVLERGSGNDEAAFEAIKEAEALSLTVCGDGNELTTVLQEEAADIPPAPAEQGREARSGEWVAWTPRALPDLAGLPDLALAELIAEVARAEGPLTQRRLYGLLATASGAQRVGRSIREQIDRAVAAGGRRRLLASVTPYRGCDPGERIVAIAGSPTVKVRPRGDRDLDEVPLTELADVARRAMEAEPDAPFEAVARTVMRAYGSERLTDRVAALMRRAVQIAERDRAMAASESDRWARVHHVIGAIPPGRWTTLQDLAELAGTIPGWVGRHLCGKWDLPGLHRVLEPDGRPWRWFQWPAGGDRGDVVAVLRAEHAIRADESVADPDLRLTAGDLHRLVGEDVGPAAGLEQALGRAKQAQAKASTEREVWTGMHRAIAGIPAGRWTALQDLAELAGTIPGWVGRHLQGKWDLPGLHRVLEPDGRPWRWFQWPAGGDRGDVVALLRAEGAVQGDASVADPGLRLGAGDLRQLLEVEGTLVEASEQG